MRALLLLAALLAGCAEKATPLIVAGLAVASPEVQLAGHIDVGAETAATVFAGDPAPIEGASADVRVRDATVVSLPPEPGRPGFYRAELPPLQAGDTYTFTVKLPGDSAPSGGFVSAPTPVSPASLVFTPAPQPIMGVLDVKSHPKDTALSVAWQAQNGRHAFVTVLRASASPGAPETVYDTRPDTPEALLAFTTGDPPASLEIPASVFDRDAAYAVVLVALDRGELLPNTDLRSPILAGSGAALVLAVGSFRP